MLSGSQDQPEIGARFQIRKVKRLDFTSFTQHSYSLTFMKGFALVNQMSKYCCPEVQMGLSSLIHLLALGDSHTR